VNEFCFIFMIREHLEGAPAKFPVFFITWYSNYRAKPTSYRAICVIRRKYFFGDRIRINFVNHWIRNANADAIRDGRLKEAEGYFSRLCHRKDILWNRIWNYGVNM